MKAGKHVYCEKPVAVDVPGAKRVLDLGCGDGTTALPAAKLGADVVGVDIARNLETAKFATADDFLAAFLHDIHEVVRRDAFELLAERLGVAVGLKAPRTGRRIPSP